MNAQTNQPKADASAANTHRDEDLLYGSQSAHFHCRSQAVRFPGDLDDDERAQIQRGFDAGEFEPVPIQITARNRQNEPIRVRSEWDGVQLHLDVCPTQHLEIALRPALRATARFYAGHWLKFAAVVAVVVVVVVGGLFAAGVL